MSTSPQLSPPGSSTYDSATLHVGDGTWDASRDTFLLPNLMGLNFDTMRYNGMGNRFRNMSGYHSLIRAHGTIAAITFLGIVPAAIMFARFYHRSPRTALRVHVWLQILTVLLSTVVFVLGFFAVGRPRSLTNPHHGIGLALYVMILFQVIAGSWIHHHEKGKERHGIPLKLMLHQWLGRAIALLGIAQIPLGLTLYGSPKTLFILYALWVFVLLLIYFILTYKYHPSFPFDDGGSYYSGTRTDITRDRRSHRGRRLGALAAAGAAGAGLAAMRRRSRSRSHSRRHADSRTDVISSHRNSRRHSASYVDDKYTEDEGPEKQHTWRNRLLGAAAGAGAFAALKGMFSRKEKDGKSEVSAHYPPRPLGRPQSPSVTDISRVEEGRVPASPATPANDRWRREEESTNLGVGVGRSSYGSPTRPVGRLRRSGESLDSFDSRTDITPVPQRPGGHGARNILGAVGVAGFIHKFRNRRKQKEDRRVEEMREYERDNERIARQNSQRRKYTADGIPPPRRQRRHSLGSTTEITGSNPELSRHTLPPPPAATGGPSVSVPPAASNPSGSRATVVPVPPPMPGVESGSEAYASPGGGQHRRHRLGPSAAAGPSSRPPRDSSLHRSSAGESVASPPVSVKVKMHGDGRHVTLRRLNEEEAAAEREARKRGGQRRQRASSLSSVSGVGEDRWRRTEAAEAAQAHESTGGGSSAPIHPISGPPPGPPPGTSQSAADELFYPPPPIPASASGIGGSVSSPPYETGTDVSNYNSNRQRRRAERARAQQAARGTSGSRVEFS